MVVVVAAGVADVAAVLPALPARLRAWRPGSIQTHRVFPLRTHLHPVQAHLLLRQEGRVARMLAGVVDVEAEAVVALVAEVEAVPLFRPLARKVAEVFWWPGILLLRKRRGVEEPARVRALTPVGLL